MKRLLSILLIAMACISVQATLYEHNYPSGASHSFGGSPVRFGQTFTIGTTATNEKFVLDSLALQVNLNTNHVVTIGIYALSGGLPTGSAISTGSIPADGLTMQWRYVEMTSVALQASTSYAVVFYTTDVDASVFQTIESGTSSYSGGSSIYYDGSTWSAYSAYDLGFVLYGKNAPIIITQPTSLTQCAGTNATFSVVVDSDSPTYQWRKGGSNISGATSSSYTKNGIASGDAGSYDCVVTESLLGTTTTSSSATLTVNATTTITGQPSSLTRCTGTSATFTVTATGTGLSYQWRKDGANISATSASYTISSVATYDAASYTCVVTGTCSAVTSNIAVLTVNTSPSITTQPSGLSVNVGAQAVFSVTATGTGLTYQWKKGSNNISGATSSSYTIISVASSDAANYSVVITGTCATVTSNTATLTIGSNNCFLESYWRFENNGTDQAGNYNLTPVGSAGYISTSGDFLEGSYAGNTNIASGDRFQTSGDYNFGTGGLTIVFSFKNYNTSGYKPVFDTRKNGSGDGVYCFLDNANNAIYLWTSNGTVTGQIGSATNAYTRGAWTHVAIRLMSTTGNTGKFFVNGVQSGYDTTLQGGWDLTAQLAVGGNFGDASFFGYFDNWSIYKSALSNAKILDLYNNRTNNYTASCSIDGGGEVGSSSRRKILLALKLRDIILKNKRRDFGEFISGLVGDINTANFARNRTYILSGDAVDNDVVGELIISANWDTTATVVYSLQTDTSGAFAVSGDKLIATDVSALTDNVQYRITYKIVDGIYSDSAYAYITKPPAADCYTVTNWASYDNNFATGKYYFQARGTSLNLASELTLNANNLYIGAIGTGVRPKILKNYSNTGNDGHQMINLDSRTGVTIQSLELRANSIADQNYWVNFGIAGASAMNITLDGVIIDGRGSALNAYFSNALNLNNCTNITLNFVELCGTIFDGSFNEGIYGMRATSINVHDVGYDAQLNPTNYDGGDGFQFGTTSYSLYFGYSNIDKTSNKSKHGLILYGIRNGTADHDTIEFCNFRGDIYRENDSYPSSGLSLNGVSGSVVRYNKFNNFYKGINIFADEGPTGATSANLQIYRNLIVNSFLTSIHFYSQGTGNKVYNNTFVTWGTHPGNYAYAASAITCGGWVQDFQNNIFYTGNSVNPFYGLSGSSTVDYNLYLYRGNYTLNTHEIEDDPIFLGTGDHPYELSLSSPAIDAGATISSGSFDLKLTPVPQNSIYDIGLYEVIP